MPKLIPRASSTTYTHNLLLSAASWDGTLTHHVLHLGCNIQGQVRSGAPRSPRDVAERGPIRGHAVLSVEQILHALRTALHLRHIALFRESSDDSILAASL